MPELIFIKVKCNFLNWRILSRLVTYISVAVSIEPKNL